MSMDEKSTLRVSFVTGGPELRIAPVSTILSRVQSGPVWDVASIAPLMKRFLYFRSSGTRAMDSSFSVTSTNSLGATFFWLVPVVGLPRLKSTLGARHLNDGRRNCSFPRSSRSKRWSTFSTSGNRIRPCTGSGSMPFLGRRSGKAIKVERPGNGRSTNRTPTSNKAMNPSHADCGTAAGAWSGRGCAPQEAFSRRGLSPGR